MTWSRFEQHRDNTSSVVIAEQAARQRLINAYVRETGQVDPRVRGRGCSVEIDLPATGRILLGTVKHYSLFGHHEYGDAFELNDGKESRLVDHTEVVAALLDELGARHGVAGAAELAKQINNSIERTITYLDNGPPARPLGSHDLTRYAEQTVLLGHPFHPTPKSMEGFASDDLTAYAPELGASFVLHWYAVADELLVQRCVAARTWTPEDVRSLVPQGFVPLPAHPWQARRLDRSLKTSTLVRSGGLVSLGQLGNHVYPMSSVRTACDPTFPTTWKLPLSVRITNFVRTNPIEQLQRAVDASAVLMNVRPELDQTGLRILPETGYRTIDDRVLAPEFGVLFRDNPFGTAGDQPQVLASLLEQRANGPPELIRQLAKVFGDATGDGPDGSIAEWLRRYLRIAVLPILSLFVKYGVSLEAHVQNSLLCIKNGWPHRLYIRDMEGTSVSRTRCTLDVVSPESPLFYADDEAWKRLQYYLITNHLGHLIHVLGRRSVVVEAELWRVVRDFLSGEGDPCFGRELVETPTLPAKANLVSRFTGCQENPSYVQVPNPIYEVS